MSQGPIGQIDALRALPLRAQASIELTISGKPKPPKKNPAQLSDVTLRNARR